MAIPTLPESLAAPSPPEAKTPSSSSNASAMTKPSWIQSSRKGVMNHRNGHLPNGLVVIVGQWYIQQLLFILIPPA